MKIHWQRIAWIIGVLGLTPGSSWAGNWSGGGGEILEHAQNPWFLDGPGRPLKEVSYCVIAGDDFSVPTPALRTIVSSSISWWDHQFGNAFYPDNEVTINGKKQNLKISVNTSRFREEECKDTTDLAFQFGYLSKEQLDEFERLKVDLTRFVALTIRTDYNEKLQGRGFIYVSPDRGDRAFRGQNVLPDVWTRNQDNSYYRLRSVLTHELGHVFGLAHSNANDSIMSARLAEIMVTPLRGGALDPFLAGISSSVFFPNSIEAERQFCGAARPEFKLFREFFEIPAELDCFRISLDLSQLIVLAGTHKDGPTWDVIGRARFADGGQRRHHQLVTLWMPPGQTLFAGLPDFFSALFGPASTEVQQTATFSNKRSGSRREIFVQNSPRYVQIGGFFNGRFVTDLLPVTEYGRRISGWGDQ